MPPMTYDLYLGDRSFSSWSLRGWLMFEKYNIPHRVHMLDLYDGGLAASLAALAPARLVPTMRTPAGEVVGETMAIAETLAERHPDAGLWPADPAARARARWLAAEMHAGFNALRNECPMQLLHQYRGFEPSAALMQDLQRLQQLWTDTRQRFGDGGPWLFGAYSLADAFYAPVAARIAGYDLPVEDAAAAYVATVLSDTAFRRWRTMGLLKSHDPVPYAMDLSTGDWPGPKPLPARAVTAESGENTACPYSGKPVSEFLEIEGRLFGFCNSLCRDKTVKDPLAWPEFVEILHRDRDVPAAG